MFKSFLHLITTIIWTTVILLNNAVCKNHLFDEDRVFHWLTETCKQCECKVIHREMMLKFSRKLDTLFAHRCSQCNINCSIDSVVWEKDVKKQFSVLPIHAVRFRPTPVIFKYSSLLSSPVSISNNYIDCATTDNKIYLGYYVAILSTARAKTPSIGYQLVTSSFFPDMNDEVPEIHNYKKHEKYFFGEGNKNPNELIRFILPPRLTDLTRFGDSPRDQIVHFLEQGNPLVRATCLDQKESCSLLNTHIRITALCNEKRKGLSLSDLVLKLRLLMRRYAKAAGKHKIKVLSVFFYTLDRIVMQSVNDFVDRTADNYPFNDKCVMYVLSNDYNKLFDELLLTIPGYYPNSGIKHSQILKLLRNKDTHLVGNGLKQDETKKVKEDEQWKDIL